MKIPKTIKVGALTYTVNQDKILADAKDCWGYITPYAQVINLDPSQHIDRLPQSLLHELTHAAFKQGGLHHLIGEGDKLTEEMIVDGVSQHLYTIIKDNKLDFIND